MASGRNTVRLELERETSVEVKERFGVEWICLRILKEIGKLKKGQIFCMQDFTRAGFVDITLVSPKVCREFYEACVEGKEKEGLKGLRVRPLFGEERVPLTVHMFNPYLEDKDVKTFLQRYCAEVSEAERLLNKFGIWTGRRRFMVRFRTDMQVPGGLMYPPGAFAIGPNRGFLWFPGQQATCWKCGESGHEKDQCKRPRCRNCGAEGHEAARCGEARSCSLCGSKGHLYRQCPKRESSYANRAGGKDKVEVEKEKIAEGEERMEVVEQPRKRTGSWAEEVEREEKRQAKGEHMADQGDAILEEGQRRKKGADDGGKKGTVTPRGEEEKEDGESQVVKVKAGALEGKKRNENTEVGGKEQRDKKDSKLEGLFKKDGWREVERELRVRYPVSLDQLRKWVDEVLESEGKGIIIECGDMKYKVREVDDIHKVCYVSGEEFGRGYRRERK